MIYKVGWKIDRFSFVSKREVPVYSENFRYFTEKSIAENYARSITEAAGILGLAIIPVTEEIKVENA